MQAFGLDAEFFKMVGMGIAVLILLVLVYEFKVLGWVIIGFCLITLNTWWGASWLAILPGAVSRTEAYLPSYAALLLQLFVTILEFMLFSGSYRKGALDTWTEWAFFILGWGLVISDIFANTMNFALAGNYYAPTALDRWWQWFIDGLANPGAFVAWAVSVFISILVAVGGEVSISKSWTQFAHGGKTNIEIE